MTSIIGQKIQGKQSHSDLAAAGEVIAGRAFKAQDELTKAYDVLGASDGAKVSWLKQQGVKGDLAKKSSDQLDGLINSKIQRLQLGMQKAFERLSAFQEMAKNMHEILMTMIRNLKLS
jgi:hypothetical protein